MSAPGAPTGVTAAPGSGTATLTFTAGAANGSAITNYKYSTDGTNYTALSPAQASSPITISGLTNNTWYTIYLKAVNANGDSAASAGVSVMPSVISTTPNSISGLQVWYDGRDPAGTSVLPSNGAAVSTWVNKASGSYNATATAGKEATYDATLKALTFVSGKNYSTGYTGAPATETMFVVFKVNPAATSFNNTLIAGELGARGFGAGFANGATNSIGVLNNQVAWLATAGGIYGANAIGIGTTTVSSTGATTTVALNGGTIYTKTAGTPFTAGTTTYLGIDTTGGGATYYFAGSAMEIIIYNVALTTTQKQQVEGYLAWKWGVQSSLPYTHPYARLFPLSTYIIGTGLTTEVTTATGTFIDSSGNVYVTGNTTTSGVTLTGVLGGQIKSGTVQDNYVTKYNASGVLQWGAFIRGSLHDYGNGIASDASGNVYVTGQTSTSGLTISGVSGGQTKSGTHTDAFFAKYSATGTLLWGKIIGGTGTEAAYGISIESSGNVYVTGFSTQSGFTLSGVNGGQMKPADTGGDAFVAKYDPNGVLLWGRFVGIIGGDELGLGSSLDSSGNLYITGYAASTFTLSGISGGQTKAAGSGTDIFIAKYNTNGALLWGRFLGGAPTDAAWAISNDTFGNVYVAGYTNGAAWTLSGVSGGQTKSTSNQDAVIAKYDANGVLQWGKFIGNTGADQAIGVANDTSGNVYVTGYLESTGFTLSGVLAGFTTTTATRQGFVAKYDGVGALQWAYLLNSQGYSAGWAIATNASTVVVAGTTNTRTPSAPLTISGQSTNTWGLVQTFSISNLVGTTINVAPTASVIRSSVGSLLSQSILTGGSASVPGTFAFTTPSTVLTQTGVSTHSVTFTPTDSTYYATSTTTVSVTLISAALNTYVIGTGLATGSIIGHGVAIDSSGNMYVTGYTSTSGVSLVGVSGGQISSRSDSDVFVAKYDANGVLQWGNFLGGTRDEFVRARSTTYDIFGNVYVTGYTYSSGWTLSGVSGGQTSKATATFGDAFVAQYNTIGVLQWGKFLTGYSYDFGQEISSDASGNVYMAGWTFSSGFSTLSGISGGDVKSTTNVDGYIVKYNVNGTLLWGELVGGLASDQAKGIYSDASGNVYVTGFTSSSGWSLSGVSGGDIKVATGQDAFIAKYNTNGILQWGRIISGVTSDYGLGVTNDVFGNVYTTGWTNSSGFTLSGVSGGQTKSTINQDGYLARYNSNGVLQWGTLFGPLARGSDPGQGVSSDSSGNVYVVGYTLSGTAWTLSGSQGGFTTGANSSQGYVSKYNTNGILQWAYLLNSEGYSQASSVSANTNTIVVAGYTNTRTPTAPLAYSGQSTNLWGLVQTFTTSDSLQVPITILSAPTASTINYGQTLSASTLTGGSANVSGAFAWTTPSTVPNAGTAAYGVTFTPSDSVTYSTATTTASVTVSGKANSTITVTSSLEYTYTGSPVGPNAVITTGSTGAVTYVYKGVGYESSVQPTNVGFYNVTATLAADANYSDVSSTWVYFIIKYSSSVSITNASPYTYTGFTLSPTASKSGSTATIINRYVGISGTSYSYTATPPTNVGTYRITSTVAEDSYYYSASANATFTIVAAAATLTNGSDFSVRTKEYDGTTQATLTATPRFQIGSRTLQTLRSTVLFDTKNVGTSKTVTITDITSSPNYTTAAVQKTGTITARALTITGLSVANKVYNGTTAAQLSGTPVLVGVLGGETVTVTGTATAVFSSAAVGSFKQITVTGYTLSGADAGNYTLTQPNTLRASITKATPSISVTGATVTYTGGRQTISATATGVVSDSLAVPTVIYTNNVGTAAYSSRLAPINVGAYTVTATSAATSTYNSASATATLTITKASQTMGTFFTPADVVSSRPPFNITPPTCSTGTVVLSVVSGPITLSGTVATITGTGTVIVAANVPASANYDAATQVTASFSVLSG